MTKINLKTPNGDIALDLFYVIDDMRRVSKSVTRINSAYKRLLLVWADEMEQGGIIGTKRIYNRLKVYFGSKEKWFAQDCKTWHYWLNLIIMTNGNKSNVKNGTQVLYAENYEKIFN